MGGEGGHEQGEEHVDLGPVDLAAPPPRELPPRPVEKTRATLAYLLFALLAAVIAADLALLAAGTLTPQSFDNVTGVVLAPVVGLLGAATGYYYGRGDR